MSRRTITVILTAALIGGLVAAPADAGKKKKKKPVPVDVQYFLQSNPDDACNEAGWVLALEPAQSAGCGLTQSGIPYELQIQAGAADPRELGQQFIAQEGLPIVLNTAKKLTGEITTRGFNQVALGHPTIEINVFGTAGGEEVAIGTFSEDAIAAPTQMHTSEFEIDIAEEAEGTAFEDLSLQVLIRGASVGHSVVEMNSPMSFVVIPTLQKK